MKFLKGQRVRFIGERAKELVKHKLLTSVDEVVTCTQDSDNEYVYTTYHTGNGSSYLNSVVSAQKHIVVIKRK